MAFAVSQRTQELGIRIALGATTSDVLKLVVRHGMKLALLGIGIGLVGAWALTRFMKALLVGVEATDLLTFAVVSGCLFIAALLACYLPARRATKVDPLIALRYE
jgi:ABC-type antimicrobial peptide transport system permease subunit